MKIQKQDIDSLYDPDISKKEYDRIVGKIEERFSEIVLTMIPKIKSKGWFDFGNCNYDAEDSGGEFDPDEYRTQISVGGEYAFLPEPYANGEFDNSFPTRWLWEDFEEEFKSKVQKFKEDEIAEKEKAKLKRESSKITRQTIQNTIRSKLTPEELKHIVFKS